MILQIIDASKAWKDAWVSILSYQNRLVGEFETLYAPIVGAGPEYQGHVPVETPEATVIRTAKLRQEYEELRKDLMQDVAMVDLRMVQPVTDARNALAPMKKTIKKREDKKVSFFLTEGIKGGRLMASSWIMRDTKVG